MKYANEYIYIYLTTVSVVGVFGNLIVAFMYSQKKDKHTSTFFILVLSLSDLSVCLILVPLTIYMEKIGFETTSLIMCKLYFFLTTAIVPSSSLLMLAIAFDRYACICMVNKNVINLFRAKLIVIVLLIISALCGIIPGLHAKLEGVLQIDNLTNETYTFDINVCFIDSRDSFINQFKDMYDLVYALSVIFITFLYILIYKEIYKRGKMKKNRKKEILINSLINRANSNVGFNGNQSFYVTDFPTKTCINENENEETAFTNNALPVNFESKYFFYGFPIIF